ncbi:PAS domain-containing sensor histidine kinase [Actomonas aquatica]|uniref:histidine kinase n=1 Tax=Actomonas aquatica TaxID=2866162 RepID=A0ABZ1C637_9BACT|nr:PAS domain S-box protein [Opitutus sp. WL0086]WRQ87115.1 PAS domain S-box protein [Opitutus sp. WL0086]
MSLPRSPLSTLSFRTWLILGTGLWTLILAIVTGLLVERASQTSVATVMQVNLHDRLDQSAFRTQQLLRAAELSLDSTSRLTPRADLPPAQRWPELLQRALPVFEQRPELTRLGFSTGVAGEYAYLWRHPSGRIDLHGPTTEATPVPLPPAAGLEPDTFHWSALHPLVGLPATLGITCFTPGNAPDSSYWWAEYDLDQLHRFVQTLNEETGLRVALFDLATDPPLWVGHHEADTIAGVTAADQLSGLHELDPLISPELLPPAGAPPGSGPAVARDLPDASSWLVQGTRLPAPFARWGVVGALAESQTLVPDFSPSSVFFTAALVIVVLSSLMAWIMARLLAHPIEALTTSVADLADSGKIDIPTTTAPREIQDLRDVLDEQGSKLIERQEELAEINTALQRQISQRQSHEATLNAIFENTPFDLWTTDADGVYTYQNRYSRNLHGNIIGQRIDDLDVSPSLLADRVARSKRVLQGEIISSDTIEQTPTGRHFYHILEAPILQDAQIVGSLGVKIDLTEHRRAENALRDSQQRISRHLENTPLGVVDFDASFHIRSWNAAAEAIFGWKAAEAIGRLGTVIVPPDDREEVDDIWRKLLQNPESSRNFNRNLTRDGRIIDCEWYNTPITDSDGRIIGVSSLVLDVTERLAAERLFRESEERFQRVFHQSPTPQCITSYPEGHLIDINQAWTDALGHSREAALGRTGLELGLWADLEDRRRFLQQLTQHGQFPGQVVELLDASGRPHQVLLCAARTRLGYNDCLVISVPDLTERIAAQEALRENRQLLETLVEQLPGLSFRCLIDESWSMLWVSRGSLDLTGYPPEAFLDRSISFGELIVPAHRARAQHVVERAVQRLQEPRRYSLEYQITHRDGRTRWLWEQGEIVRNPSTHFDEIVGFIADISDRKAAEKNLRDLNENLEQRVAARTAELEAANLKLTDLDRLKTEFLATMSHELRTPLNSIIGFSSILERGLVGPLTDEQHLQIGLVNQSARQLLDLINDLLDVSRIDSGRMEIMHEEVVVADLLRSVETELTANLDPARLTFSTTCPPDLPILVSDHRRLRQVIFNLAANAIKFTPGPDGHVTVTAQATAEGGVTIAVTDTGIGIKAEHLPQLFEAFRQVDGSARRLYDGVGLGLNLVRKLTAKLGGHISVKSEFGRGSCFTVTLPPISPGA